MKSTIQPLDFGLRAGEASLLDVLVSHTNRWGEINLCMEQLGDLTGSSRTTLWRRMTVLEEKGLIETTRTKRNYGKLYKNRYKLLVFKIETSTAGQSSHIDNLTTVTTVTTKVKNTSYSLWGFAPEMEEIEMVNKWQDDDEVGGFGLLDGELPATQRQKPASKRDPKTRNQRPQHEWTPNDVASEFASQLYSKVRGIPGLLNIRKLAPILGKYRKDYGTTALFELEVIDMLINDSRRLADIKKDPANAYRIFLRMLATHGKKAQNNLEFEEIENEPELVIDYLIASDGKKFDNSMPGRVELKEYEKSLKEAE
jgi:DNA-binding Lrp family transcriptional regulator